MVAIVSRQTAKGIIEVDLDETCNFRARIDGKSVPNFSIAGIQTVEELLSKPYSRKVGEHLRKAGFSHLLGSTVALHADEVDRLNAAFDAAKETNPHTLRSRRESLVHEINRLGDTAHDDHVEAIERASATGRYRQPDDRIAEIAKAQAALAEFDAAHPEIVAEIQREHAESVKRNMWN